MKNIIYSSIIVILISLVISNKNEGLKFLTDINADIKINAPAAVADSFITVSWKFSNDVINDAILGFYRTDSSNAYNLKTEFWEFTYGGQEKKKLLSEKEGMIKIKTPSLPGLYKIQLCNDEDVCFAFKEISITTCIGKPKSSIEHIIVIISENHSFDSIYGNYCKAETYSKPNCNHGSECCEAAPKIVDGYNQTNLDNDMNLFFSPCHNIDCELSEMDEGKMDRYIIGGVGSDPLNFAVANEKLNSANYYYKWAKEGAMSDNFFQSTAGASCANDMYFATSRFVFRDNDVVPQNKDLNGARCFESNFISYDIPTVTDLLNACNVTWTFYAEGFNLNPSKDQCYPYYYDASDNPFTYFPSLTNSTTSSQNFRDYDDLIVDILDNKLPSVSYLKGLGIHSEHPGYKDSLLTGQALTENIINLIKSSSYINNTVVIIVPDESGGYYDHVYPPHKSQVDGTEYGPRTQFIVYGEQTKKNYVSHIMNEPSSIIRFIEWNWLGGDPGQLGARDAITNNLGDLFDENKTGIKIPKY